MKDLVLEYLTRNNQGSRQKNFQEGAIDKKQKNEQLAHQKSLPLLAVADKGTCQTIIRGPTSKISCIVSPA